MKAVLVDDEAGCLEYLFGICMGVPQLEIEGTFSNALEALAFLKEHPADLVFLDVEMPGLSGVQAVEHLQAVCPGIEVVFVTGYEKYAVHAFRADAADYLLKPCDLEEVCRAVEKVERRKSAVRPAVKRLEVRTFGMVGIFVDGKPYRFTNGKAKELFALLVDKQGAVVTMEQAIALIWEERAYDDAVKQLYRKAVMSLNQFQKELGLEVFVSHRGSCNIIPDQIECDYYKLLEGDQSVGRYYSGEYMLEYSWAEETNGRIARLVCV